MLRISTRLMAAGALVGLIYTACAQPTISIQTPVPVIPTQAAPSAGEQATVTYVVDGDTIKAMLGGQEVTIRYIGVDTPERTDPCYAEATAANQTLVGGQTVMLTKDVSETDQYGRLLRYVYAPGNVFVNAELVKGGWALAKEYPPDTAHAAEFEAFETAAKGQNIGCWPTGVFAGVGAPLSAGVLPTPFDALSQTAAPGLTPTGPASSQVAVCLCDRNRYNCKDFGTYAKAQACYEYCKSIGAGDVHKLDADSNGKACESLP